MVNNKCLFKVSFIIQLFVLRVESGPSLRRGKNRRERTEIEQVNRRAAGDDEDEVPAFWGIWFENSMSFDASPSGQPSSSTSPSLEASTAPTAAPSPAPTTRISSGSPSESPSSSSSPSSEPSTLPTSATSPAPTPTPSGSPSESPSESSSPTSEPSTAPTVPPSPAPTPTPSGSPSQSPSESSSPTSKPSTAPTAAPSPAPTHTPSGSSSESPSSIPSQHPSDSPSEIPTSKATVTNAPSEQPTVSNVPSHIPSQHPSDGPSEIPTSKPTVSNAPSAQPTVSNAPSRIPSQHPSDNPSEIPTSRPTVSGAPSQQPTTWSTVLSLQNQVGVCNGMLNGLGCIDNAGIGNRGNPNDIVNCFNVTEFGAFIPFFVESVRFFTGEPITLPPDLKIRVWDGTATAGPTGDPLLTQEIFGFVFGENNYALDEPLEIGTEQVCIGLFSETPNAGLRIRGEESTGLQSYLKAPACGAADFVTTASTGVPLDLCIEAHVFG